MRAAQRIVNVLLEADPDPERVVFFGSSRFPAAGWYASSFKEGKADLIRYGLVDANATEEQIKRSFMWLQGSGPHLRAVGRRLYLNKEQLLAAMDFLGVDSDTEKVAFTDAAGKTYELTTAELLEPKWQAKAKADAEKEAKEAEEERAKEPEEPESLVQSSPRRLRLPPEPAEPAEAPPVIGLPPPPANPASNAANLGLETADQEDRTMRVVRVEPGTPASTADIRAGDVIFAILPASEIPMADKTTAAYGFVPPLDTRLADTVKRLEAGTPYRVFFVRKYRGEDLVRSLSVEITPE